MCFFFRAHRARLAQFLVPQACFLNETPAGFQRLYVPVNLELNRLLHETYGVQVLQLDFCPEDIVALAAYRHVSFAAKVPFFHVRFGCAHPLQRPADMIDIIVSLPGRTKVGFSDDLSQRSAGAIQIDVRKAIDIGQSLVHIFAGIFFEVQTGDSYSHRLPIMCVTCLVAIRSHDFKEAVG